MAPRALLLAIAFAGVAALFATGSEARDKTYEELFGNCATNRDNAIQCALLWVDRDGDGRMSWAEVRWMRKKILFFYEAWFSESTEIVMYRCDKDRDGFVSLEDFITSNKTCLRNCGSTNDMTERVCNRALGMYCRGELEMSSSYGDVMRQLGFEDNSAEIRDSCRHGRHTRDLGPSNFNEWSRPELRFIALNAAKFGKFAMQYRGVQKAHSMLLHVADVTRGKVDMFKESSRASPYGTAAAVGGISFVATAIVLSAFFIGITVSKTLAQRRRMRRAAV